jgi:hypothetical protein
LTVSPGGSVLPCPTAWEIPNLSFDPSLKIFVGEFRDRKFAELVI